MLLIETSRLLLRPYQINDWEKVHLYASVPEFSQYEVWGPNSIADTKHFISESMASLAMRPAQRYELAIVLKAETFVIGGCSLKLDDFPPIKLAWGMLSILIIRIMDTLQKPLLHSLSLPLRYGILPWCMLSVTREI